MLRKLASKPDAVPGGSAVTGSSSMVSAMLHRHVSEGPCTKGSPIHSWKGRVSTGAFSWLQS